MAPRVLALLNQRSTSIFDTLGAGSYTVRAIHFFGTLGILKDVEQCYGRFKLQHAAFKLTGERKRVCFTHNQL